MKISDAKAWIREQMLAQGMNPDRLVTHADELHIARQKFAGLHEFKVVSDRSFEIRHLKGSAPQIVVDANASAFEWLKTEMPQARVRHDPEEARWIIEMDDPNDAIAFRLRWA